MKKTLNNHLFLHDKSICLPTYDKADSICDFVFQTADLLCSRNVVIILALGEMTSGKNGWRSWWGNLRQLSVELTDFSKKTREKGALVQIGLFQFFPFQRFEWSRSLNRSLNLFILSKLITYYSPDPKKQLLWIFHPRESWIVRFFRKSAVYYDCIDWHIGCDQERTQLLATAKAVTAISSKAQKKISDMTDLPTVVVPQGFNPQELQERTSLPPDVKKVIKQLSGKPVTGFFGGINQRLDISLLEEVVKKFPNYWFLFVGPLGRDENIEETKERELRIHQLLQQSNVMWIPYLQRSMLLQVMEKCDVLTIPYDLSWEFNQYCFPMKIMEYFFAGKPVVSTPIPSLLKYKGLVRFANTSKDFSTQISRAIQNPWTGQQRKKALQIALDQTWEKKLNKIDAYLAKMLPSQ